MESRWRIWLLAIRPKTLPAAAVPVIVGAAVAYAAGGFRLFPVLGALAGALLIQIGTNFANDVFDFQQGADTEERVGPTRAVAAGLITPAAMRRAMIVAFGLATLCGFYLAWVGGWPMLAIGVVSIVSGIAYTGGPYPLGYHGLGDVFVMVFFGFVAVCGTVYLQLGHVPAVAWWASVPVGALATAILVVNNVRDRQTDVVAGKRTLAVRFGRGAGIAEYALLLLASYAVPFWLFWQGFFGKGEASPWVLLPLLTAPLAVRLLRDLVRLEGPPLNAVLARTGLLLMLFGLLFAVGLGWPS